LFCRQQAAVWLTAAQALEAAAGAQHEITRQLAPVDAPPLDDYPLGRAARRAAAADASGPADAGVSAPLERAGTAGPEAPTAVLEVLPQRRGGGSGSRPGSVVHGDGNWSCGAAPAHTGDHAAFNPGGDPVHTWEPS